MLSNCAPTTVQVYVFLKALKELGEKDHSRVEIRAVMRRYSQELSGETEKFVFGPRPLNAVLRRALNFGDVADTPSGYTLTEQGQRSLRSLEKLVIPSSPS